jgi:hypothetical protein
MATPARKRGEKLKTNAQKGVTKAQNGVNNSREARTGTFKKNNLCAFCALILNTSRIFSMRIRVFFMRVDPYVFFEKFWKNRKRHKEVPYVKTNVKISKFWLT